MENQGGTQNAIEPEDVRTIEVSGPPTAGLNESITRAHQTVMNVDQIPQGHIVFSTPDREKLRITPDGFFVNGEPVDVGDVVRHGQEVYKALREWIMSWRKV